MFNFSISVSSLSELRDYLAVIKDSGMSAPQINVKPSSVAPIASHDALAIFYKERTGKGNTRLSAEALQAVGWTGTGADASPEIKSAALAHILISGGLATQEEIDSVNGKETVKEETGATYEPEDTKTPESVSLADY